MELLQKIIFFAMHYLKTNIPEKYSGTCWLHERKITD